MHGARILVVGAGLAGLALARALGRAGFAPELIEREAGWEAAGTGMYLPANGVRALGALGLEEAVAARATAAGCWPRSTWTGCGGTSGPAWPCPGPTSTRSCAMAWPSGWAGRSRRWSTWTGRSG